MNFDKFLLLKWGLLGVIIGGVDLCYAKVLPVCTNCTLFLPYDSEGFYCFEILQFSFTAGVKACPTVQMIFLCKMYFGFINSQDLRTYYICSVWHRFAIAILANLFHCNGRSNPMIYALNYQ